MLARLNRTRLAEAQNTKKNVIFAGSGGGGGSPAMWSIRVYQYECSSPVLAPVGCLQYFHAVTGVVESFNYKDDVSVVPGGSGLTGVNHLAKMDYSACVRMAAGYCGIRWSQYPGIQQEEKQNCVLCLS